jgi:hypothetical protein
MKVTNHLVKITLSRNCSPIKISFFQPKKGYPSTVLYMFDIISTKFQQLTINDQDMNEE